MNYLILLASLIAFFCIIIFYTKYTKNNLQSNFGKSEVNNQEIDSVLPLDTRYTNPLTPPVYPNAYNTEVLNSVPVDKNLYTDQDFSTNEYILDEQKINYTNQLNYSGGSTQLIKIPLQYNEPHNEQLRTQEVLITPYNRIKYSINEC